RARVIAASPWLFDRHVLLLRPLEEEVHPLAINLSFVSFLMRVYGVPYLGMKVKVGESIGKTVRLVEKVEVVHGKGGNGSYFRIIVMMDVQIPIKIGLNLSLGKEGKTWIVFKYECIAMFCHRDNCMGHQEKHC
ncbi:DUF4283 domain-containing protein/zf-CCHC_4 domain-containing protein, partial [Cephalotus follicularis]